ncbi:MAG: MTH1187 family thiamine-binding protein [Desulfovibrio sp.]|nr:MTH1187 family thiamine-binding protein [Desulfovibrio sp.]MCA1987116.1 MTH1187 family thiamine-binding protein [Desulfovibrio sp.]
MSVIVNLAIFPLDQGPELVTAVTRAVAIIRQSGLPCQLGPMGTAIEGEYDEVMAVVKACHDALRAHSSRVYMNMAIDSRQGPAGRLQQKVQDVEDLLKQG